MVTIVVFVLTSKLLVVNRRVAKTSEVYIIDLKG